MAAGQPRNRATIEAWRKYKKGEINAIEQNNELSRSYGFEDNADFRKAARLTVMKMIALKINHPYYSAGYSVQYQVDLIREYQKVKVEFKCECCGQVKDFHFMTIDHSDNNGSEHKREAGNHTLTHHILIHGFDPKYRLGIMCWDCNASLGQYGFCPHHPEVKREVKRSTKKLLNSVAPLQNTPDSLKPRLCNLMEA